MSSGFVTAYRAFFYLKRNGVVRGGAQLYRIFRQMHELRLGEFKGKDCRGNEYYLDPYAQWGRQRFVVYGDGQPQRSGRHPTAAAGTWLRLCARPPCVWLCSQTRSTTRRTSPRSGTGGCTPQATRRRGRCVRMRCPHSASGGGAG